MSIVLVLVAVRFGLLTMMAELCFSVDDFSLFVFFVFQQHSSRHRKVIRQLRAPSLLTPQGITTATGTVAAEQQRLRAPTTPARTASSR